MSLVNIGNRPTGPRSSLLVVSRPFQCVAIDLVEYKASAKGFHNVLSVIDHLTRFLLLVPLQDKSMSSSHMCFHFFPRLKLNDQGPEFENELVRELQHNFGQRITAQLWFQEHMNVAVSSSRKFCSGACASNNA